MQLCGGLNWRILDLGCREPISPSLQASGALAANGHKKPVVKALKPASWVVMAFGAQNALRKNFVLEGKGKKIILKLLCCFVLKTKRGRCVEEVHSLTSLGVHAKDQIQSELIAGWFRYRTSSVLTSLSWKSIWKLPFVC